MALCSISSSVYGLARLIVNIETMNIYKTPRVESEEDLTMLRTKYNCYALKDSKQKEALRVVKSMVFVKKYSWC